ncbi:MAG: glycosyltransferase family 2 protein [Acidobacteriaceae bacterium]
MQKPIMIRPLPPDPFVSVIVTSFNYSSYISRALISVLRQDHRNMEIIVADDGSMDDTVEIVERFQSTDLRIHLVKGENVGQPKNMTRGYRACQGEIICFLDADDEFYPGKIKSVIEAFRASPDCGLCIHQMQRADRDGRPFGPLFPRTLDSGWLHSRLLRNGGRCSFPATSAIAIRRQVAELVFPLNSNWPGAADAFVQYPAAFLTGVCVAHGARSLYRWHGANMTASFKTKAERLAWSLKEYEEVFAVNQQFVQVALGSQYSVQIKLTDNQQYVELAARYLAVSCLPEYRGQTLRGWIGLLRSRRRRVFWTALALLPKFILMRGILLRSSLRNSRVGAN